MRRTVASAVFATALLGLPVSHAVAQSAESVAGTDQRLDLNVTVFTNGQALVQETRPIGLAAGANDVALDGMPQRLRPETVLIKSNCAIPFALKSVAFDTAILNQQSLLRAHVGKTIGVLKKDPATGMERVVPATVLSASHPPVLEIDGKTHTGVTDPLVFDQRPATLRPAPALTVALDAQGAGPCPTALAYLTDGLTWRADYTAILSNEDRDLTLIGGATVTNASGGDFSGATLNVMAGRMNRAGGVSRTVMMAPSLAKAEAAPAPREAVEGLQRYDLGTNVDLRDGRVLRLPLLSTAMAATVERTYRLGAWTHQMRGPVDPPQHPQIVLTATAPDDAGPLPAGTIRVFRPEAGGALALAGESRLGDTSAGRPFTVTLSDDMDITLDRTQTAFKRLSSNTVETAEKLVVHNGKDKPTIVKLRIAFPGQWQISGATLEPNREDAATALWTLLIPANTASAITYTATVIY